MHILHQVKWIHPRDMLCKFWLCDLQYYVRDILHEVKVEVSPLVPEFYIGMQKICNVKEDNVNMKMVIDTYHRPWKELLREFCHDIDISLISWNPIYSYTITFMIKMSEIIIKTSVLNFQYIQCIYPWNTQTGTLLQRIILFSLSSS